jgi:hypothetical protein
MLLVVVCFSRALLEVFEPRELAHVIEIWFLFHVVVPQIPSFQTALEGGTALLELSPEDVRRGRERGREREREEARRTIANIRSRD